MGGRPRGDAPRTADGLIVIDTSVWISLLNGVDHPKAALARELIEGPEDIGVPGTVLEEILRGLKSDAQFRRVRDLLLSDFTYIETRQSHFIRSAEIYRTLRKKGRTIGSAGDCLIAACVMEERASLLEDDGDFRTIAEIFPLDLLVGS